MAAQRAAATLQPMMTPVESAPPRPLEASDAAAPPSTNNPSSSPSAAAPPSPMERVSVGVESMTMSSAALAAPAVEKLALRAALTRVPCLRLVSRKVMAMLTLAAVTVRVWPGLLIFIPASASTSAKIRWRRSGVSYSSTVPLAVKAISTRGVPDDELSGGGAGASSGDAGCRRGGGGEGSGAAGLGGGGG